jgi:hypothetical protein
MYRTDHAHRWQPTDYVPMSSSYARTLYDDAPLMMTGDTRPAEFGHTKSGDEVFVRRSGFGVDINTDSLPLDVLAQRLAPGSIVSLICYGGSCHQGRRECTEHCAEIAAARMAGAGMQEPSAPMPLQLSERTTQHRWSRAADYVVAALFAGCLIGWALGSLM